MKTIKEMEYLKRLFPNFFSLGLFFIMLSMIGLLAFRTVTLTETLVAGLLALVSVKYWKCEVEDNEH